MAGGEGEDGEDRTRVGRMCCLVLERLNEGASIKPGGTQIREAATGRLQECARVGCGDSGEEAADVDRKS